MYTTYFENLMKTMLDTEFKYYKEHQKELVTKYQNRFIVIVGNEVIGDYNTEIDAYQDASNKYSLGSFLIQQCLDGSDNYTQTFNSRVIFA